jgi:hypothetical protein
MSDEKEALKHLKKADKAKALLFGQQPQPYRLLRQVLNPTGNKLKNNLQNLFFLGVQVP